MHWVIIVDVSLLPLLRVAGVGDDGLRLVILLPLVSVRILGTSREIIISVR